MVVCKPADSLYTVEVHKRDKEILLIFVSLKMMSYGVTAVKIVCVCVCVCILADLFMCHVCRYVYA